MVHQNLKPDNILIDSNGTLKLIDFSSTRIAGVEEINTTLDRNQLHGTVNYTAPEFLDGERGSVQSDIFSLGVIAYELMTGELPHGEAEKLRPAHKHHYQSARLHNDQIPYWVDGALAKATQPNRKRRYDSVTEFLYDLSHPNKAYTKRDDAPPCSRKTQPLFGKGFRLRSLLRCCCYSFYSHAKPWRDQPLTTPQDQSRDAN